MDGWDDLCHAAFTALGVVFTKLLLTKGGLITVFILALGILFVNYYWVLPAKSRARSIAESQAMSIVENQCHSAWSFYYNNGRMPSVSQTFGHNDNHNFDAIPIGYNNVSIISAQSIKSDSSNFVGIAFGPSGNNGYSCTVCKSNSYSNKNTSPVLTNGTLGCPSDYLEIERIRP